MNIISPNIAGIITIVIWSISPLLVIYSGETPPFLMASIALFIASMLLITKYLFIDKSNQVMAMRQPFKSYLINLYGIGGYILFWFLAFKNAPAFEANILNYLWPILLVFLSLVLSIEKFHINKLLGILLGFSGLTLLFISQLNFDLIYLTGYVFAIMGAFIWASYSIMLKKIEMQNGSMAYFMLLPAILFLCLHLRFEEAYLPTKIEFIFLILLGFSRISFALWNHAMNKGNIPFIAALAYFIPITSTFLIYLAGFTPRNEHIALGAVLVLLGCITVNFNSIKKIYNEKRKHC